MELRRIRWFLPEVLLATVPCSFVGRRGPVRVVTARGPGAPRPWTSTTPAGRPGAARGSLTEPVASAGDLTGAPRPPPGVLPDGGPIRQRASQGPLRVAPLRFYRSVLAETGRCPP